MRHNALFGAVAFARLTVAQTTSSSDNGNSGGDFTNQPKQCFPNDPTAPCVSISNIEAVCMRDGISMEDHKRCMCGGSYFKDWNGCRRCLYVNGFLSQGELNYWEGIMGSVSSSVCDSNSAPTTWVQDYFASAVATATQPTGASEDSQLTTLVSGTAVSLYYTVPSDQGPGITPTVTPETESETGTVTETSGETGTTSSNGRSTTQTQTQTGSGQGSNGNTDAAGQIYAQGAAIVAGVMAGGALFVNM